MWFQICGRVVVPLHKRSTQNWVESTTNSKKNPEILRARCMVGAEQTSNETQDLEQLHNNSIAIACNVLVMTTKRQQLHYKMCYASLILITRSEFVSLMLCLPCMWLAGGCRGLPIINGQYFSTSQSGGFTASEKWRLWATSHWLNVKCVTSNLMFTVLKMKGWLHLQSRDTKLSS